MPRVNGVLETALYVKELERSREFYRDLFELEVLAADDRFTALSVAGKQVLLLFREGASRAPIATPTGIIPPHDGSGQTHFAFSISTADLAFWEQRLGEKGISIESKMQWTRGGISIYFRDPDGHLVELATPGIWAIY
ncbi:MAG TPA: VOC family protein [Gemmataceae bacterium]|nr:VOC family protein [Gemmataceae bacterium]